MWASDIDQSRVIAYSGKGLLVIGPPGSGKTATLARRVRRLLDEGVPAQKILVLSAEGSGRAALREALGHPAGLKVETPASYAAHFLRSRGRQRRMLTRFQEYLVLQQMLSDKVALGPVWPFGNGIGVIQEAQAGLDALRRGEKAALADSPLGALNRHLEQHYDRRGLIPYTALVREALKHCTAQGDPLIEDDTHLLVDGYEHMCPAEKALVRELCRKGTAAIFTSDDGEGLPTLADRCRLGTIHRPASGRVTTFYWRFGDSSEEAAGVATTIARLIGEGVDPRAILVLYRDYSSNGGDLEMALRFSGVPYEVQGGRPLVQGMAARLVAQYFESLAEPDDEDGLYRWLSSPLVGLDLMALGRLRRGARKSGVPLERFVQEKGALWPGLDRLPGLLAARAAHLGPDASSPLLQAADDILLRSGAMARLLKDGAPTGSRRDEELRQLAQFMRMIEEYDGAAASPTGCVSLWAGDFLEVSSSFWGESPAQYRDVPAVRLMGVHQARGLEADVVFMCGVALGNFPRMGGDGALDEAMGLRPCPGGRAPGEAEESLFEVGVTRARRSLLVTYAARSGRADCEPSPLAVRRFGDPRPFSWPESALDQPGAPAEGEPQDAPLSGRPFSHSGIRDYLICPRRYFYGHVLRIQGDEPRAASLGNLVHDTLAAFHKRHEDLGQVQPDAAAASMAELLDETIGLYKQDLGLPLVADGIRRNAQELLDGYLEKVALPNWEGRRVIGLECQFELDFLQRHIQGRVDRMDRLADGSLELIDYKTSPYDQAATLGLKRRFLDVDDKPDYQPSDFQLPLYYFALSGRERVSKLSYYQLAGGNIRSFEVRPESTDRSGPREAAITGGDLDRIQELLAGVLQNMEGGHYPPQPRTGQECRSCPYSWACTPALEDGAEEGEIP